ncbi:Twisted gastrulation protein-like 1 [Acipenser ruthenus]|uniref:Twisted gastrulation protein-like 1 n=1 Tax=Acipenser ruthenus TaxID=7906 RepID=A0A444UZS8_ACIRT|nr:Twisted gastrulation protein-like 1 [Acipenser ruthenus]
MFRPIVLLAVVVTCVATSNAIGCNKALCASDVSKCFLQELCQCRVNGTRCPCCEECQLCLGAVWDQCCHCVDPVALAPTNASAECSVLFFHDCLSLRGCLRGCESVGAPRSRWFHSGCCQCIGPDCLAYGVPHPACKSCQD